MTPSQTHISGIADVDAITAQILGRKTSYFSEDLVRFREDLRTRIEGRRICVIGAGGSIGSAFVEQVAHYSPGCLHLIDLSENALAEMVRMLRSAGTTLPKDFRSIPLDFHSNEFKALLNSLKSPYDYVLNFAALKHVRSEKDQFSLMRLLMTNVVGNYDLLNHSAAERMFAVSSDKAVNPANLMGASKAFMERVFLAHQSDSYNFGSARFANVAFSDGSLLDGFLKRIRKKQPLSAPTDVKRYFISRTEAGELCLLSCFIGNHKEIFVPRMKPEDFLYSFTDIAATVLQGFGFEVELCESDAEAIQKASDITASSTHWPCYFSPADTSGEKGYEEFSGGHEKVDVGRFEKIDVVTAPQETEKLIVEEAVEQIRDLHQKGEWTKRDLIAIVKQVVPELNHLETHQNLDQKM